MNTDTHKIIYFPASYFAARTEVFAPSRFWVNTFLNNKGMVAKIGPAAEVNKLSQVLTDVYQEEHLIIDDVTASVAFDMYDGTQKSIIDITNWLKISIK